MSEQREPYGHETTEQRATGLISLGRLRDLEQAGLAVVDRAELEALRAASRVIVCAYCGWETVRDEGWRARMLEHLMTCEQHPSGKFARLTKEMETELEALRQEQKRADHWEREYNRRNEELLRQLSEAQCKASIMSDSRAMAEAALLAEREALAAVLEGEP